MTKDELLLVRKAADMLGSITSHGNASYYVISEAVSYLDEFIGENEEPEYIDLGPNGVVARKHRGNYHIVDKVRDVAIRIPQWLWNRIKDEGIV